MSLYVDALSERLLFTRGVDILADERRTSLAASLGATVADITMDRLGFHWRANTREILPSIPRNFLESGKIPDFVYDPAGTHGFQAGTIVAVEAKGSLSNNKAKRRSILNLAQNAYNEQVRHFIGAPAGDVVVASGFAIAYGTVPGESTSTLAIASPQTVSVDAQAGAPAHSLSAAASYAMQPAPKPVDQTPAPDHRHLDKYRGHGGSGDPPGGGRRRDRERRRPSGRIAYANYADLVQALRKATATATSRMASGPAKRCASVGGLRTCFNYMPKRLANDQHNTGTARLRHCAAFATAVPKSFGLNGSRSPTLRKLSLATSVRGI
jgi:hypothetical protein